MRPIKTKLYELRVARGLSGLDVARLARVNQSDVYAMENGRRVPPADSPMLQRLARALGYQGNAADLLEKQDAGAQL